MGGLARVGESFDGYTIVEALGHLGLADRYRVRAADGRMRLLDVLAVHHPDLGRRLRAATANPIVHPNLLDVQDVVNVVRGPAIVCADATGLPFSAWLETDPSVRDRLVVVRGIAAGLAALHAEGITHGYLQPAAIVVERRGGRPFARLGLPGVAAVIYGILREGGSVTSSGGSLGLPGYQAPEQQRSARATDHRSDWFALGCLMYHALAGQGPFYRLDPLTCYKTAECEGYLPVGLRASVTEEVGSLVAGLLRSDPAARTSAEAVVAALEPYDRVRRPWLWIGLVLAGLSAVALLLWVLA